MKKIIALILTLVLVVSFASVAMAVPPARVDIVTSSTTEFKTGPSGITKETNLWYLSINESTSNVTPTHRAVTRVHCGADAASATWVYSGANSTAHGYNADYQGIRRGISFRARLDNRDSGTLELHGNFYHSY